MILITAKGLAITYGDDGQHPDPELSAQAWAVEASEGRTRAGYWDWVASRLAAREMDPQNLSEEELRVLDQLSTPRYARELCDVLGADSSVVHRRLRVLIALGAVARVGRTQNPYGHGRAAQFVATGRVLREHVRAPARPGMRKSADDFEVPADWASNPFNLGGDHAAK